MNPAECFIQEVQDLLDEGELSKAIDHVYDTLDQHLLAGHFKEAEDILRASLHSEWPLVTLLSALTISTPWRDRFKVIHEALTLRIRNRAFAMGGQAKVDAVFRGIR